ncbi:hypothetical protein, partial [Mesorhizobium sp. WSM4983]|uniref:hypothetical protein n=1 Tax=Mesorhizobium sp. WSM4983 TaxID=3038540 RepID=UPI002416862B
MKKLIERERYLDDQLLIATAWKTSGQRVTPKLLDALRQREKIYQEMTAISPQGLAWQAARQTVRSPSADMLDKAGTVLTT